MSSRVWPARMQSLLREAVAEASRYPQTTPTDQNRGAGVLCELEVDGTRYVLSRLPLPARAGTLSPREREIATLVARGLPSKAIALKLGISTWTVVTHLRRIFTRFGVSSRAAMVARLLEDGLI
jgi:DNA-binding CsgD family transcriptional regulator